MHESKAAEEDMIVPEPHSDPHSSSTSPSSRRSSLHQSPHDMEQSSSPAAAQEEEEEPKTQSYALSTTSSALPEFRKTPRHLRRGLLARWAIIDETATPYAYSRRTKWSITATVALAAAAAPMGSATIMPALPVVSADFHVTDTITNLCVALYMLSMSIFPLWWSSFSETLGRRTIYIVSFLLFVLFAVLSAVATNIWMLIVMRMLSGGAAASVQAVGAGTIADIWEPKERGRAMGIFYLGPLCGPLFAPIIGGALAHGFGWRATQWFLVAYGVFVTVALVVLLPETLVKRRKKMVSTATTGQKKEGGGGDGSGSGSVTAPLSRTTTRQSVKEKTKKSVIFLKRCFLDPLKIILLLRYPAVSVTVYYSAITFGSLYFLNISVESTFSRPPYKFSTLIVGLLYIPNSLGYILASVFGGRWLDHIMKREARKAGRVDDKGRLILRPEDRMRENAWMAAVMFPAAMIWYGWSVEKGVHWMVPVCINFTENASCEFCSNS
jgi:multidrug resistance protein